MSKLEEAIAKAMDDALDLNDSAVVQVLAKAALAAIEREGWAMVPVDKDAAETIAAITKPDGGLFDGGWYVAWAPGSTDATLDASFSAHELIAIGLHMLSASPKQGGDSLRIIKRLPVKHN